MNEDKENNKTAPVSQDELRKMRRMALIKLGTMGVFSAIIIIFGSARMITK